MRLQIQHMTRYDYREPVTAAHAEVRLMPITDSSQACLNFTLETVPNARTFSYQLPTGTVHHFNLLGAHDSLVITGHSTVVVQQTNPISSMQLLEDDSGFYGAVIRDQYAEYLRETRRVPLLPGVDEFASEARGSVGAGTASFLIALCSGLRSAMVFETGATTVDTPLEEFIESRRGVCQDFAHLMLAICRRQGIPSRYMSGYICSAPRPVTQRPGELTENARRLLFDGGEWPASWPDQPIEEPAELKGAGAMHAWVECLLPGETWCGFDPANGLIVTDHYVKVHVGRDYDDVQPTKGVFTGNPEHTLDVTVSVTPE